MTKETGELASLLRRLAGRRALARAAIVFERVWPAIWPPLGVAGLFVLVALLDLPRLLPPGVHLALLVLTGLTIAGLLVRGLAGIAAPDDNAADRRLELASGLTHRPLSVLTDVPAHQEASGLVLWRAHVARGGAAGTAAARRVAASGPGAA